MEEDALEGRRFASIPARSGFARFGQIMGLDNRSAPGSLSTQVPGHLVESLTVCDVPAFTLLVAPGIANVPAGEAPFQPPELDEGQMFHQLDRSPTRRQPTLPQFDLG